ncbi:MAG: hypothetical protein ABI629_08315 [bacterium]
MLKQPGPAAAALPCGVALAVTALVYWPITQVFFHFDDFLNLYNAVNMPTGAFISQMFGSHLLLVPNAIFLLLHALVGPRAEPFMWLMLATHLVNVGLLFSVARRLTQWRWIASGAAIAWGTLPLHGAALGWYSVYGQVVCVTLFLWALLRILRSAKGPTPSGAATALTGLLVIAAGASFGIGLGFAVALPLVAFLILPPSPARRRMVLGLTAALLASGVLYRGVEWIHADSGALDIASAVRGNMKSPQIAANMLLLLASTGIIAIVVDGFFSAALSQGWIAWGALASAGVVCLGGMASRARTVVALVLLSLAAYAPIAAGRGMFAWTLGAAWLAAQGRYQYGATIGFVLALALSLSAVLGRVNPPQRVSRALFIGWLGLLLTAHWFVTAPIDRFDGQRRAVATALSAMRAKVAAAPPHAAVFIENHRFPISVLPGIERGFPGLAAVFVIFADADVHAGRRVYFIEPDPEIRAESDGGLRSDGLLIAPEDVP